MKQPDIPPLFKVDGSVTLSFYRKDGKISVSFQGWDNPKVMLEGQVFELCDGPQGVEGRIMKRSMPSPEPWTEA